VLEIPEWARGVIGIVLTAVGLAALFWAARQNPERQYIGVGIAGLCYLGIMLQIKWAWDVRESKALRGGGSAF
jgi:type IV secretory pathway TrbD component